MGDLRIGVSGWNYDTWVPKFYPKSVPKKRHLEYAASKLNSLEVNGSFYSLVRPDTWSGWYERSPEGFVWAVKGSRFITHNKKLRGCEDPLANFFAQGVLRLADKLGPFVWQLPEILKFDEERADSFLSLLPRDTHAAARLARGHDHRVAGRSDTRPHGRRPLRHALEPRHPTWFSEEAVRLLRRHGVALVFADSGKWPYVEEITASFVYLRLHGSPRTYRSTYGPKALDRWAERIRLWSEGEEPPDARRLTSLAPPRRASRDVYVYFDNDALAHAPRNAVALAERLGATAAAS